MSDKRNATQRIEDLEQALMSLFQTADNMARDLSLVKDAIKILGNKLDATAKAANLSDDAISQLMVENNVAELKSKVDDLVTQGLLSTTDTVGDSSFLVGRELDEQGNVVNPRLQFVLGALQPELQEKLRGAKTGDTVTLQEGKLKYELLEVYTIQAPQAPEAEAAPTTESPAAEAPAQEAAGS